MRFLFRVHDEKQRERAAERCARPTRLAGSMHFGYSPDREQMWVEGRPATLLWKDDRRLLPPSALSDAQELAAIALDEHGYTVEPIRPSRLDHTATVRFDRPAQGWAFLYGMHALDVPRRKPSLIGRPPETVYWLRGSGARPERAYDKGLERGTDRPGLAIRLETVVRPTGDERTSVEHFTADRIKETFMTRFKAMARSAEGVRVGDERFVREQLRDLAERGRITPRMAELLMGHIGAESVGLRRDARARRRRRAELRRLGLAQALDGLGEGQSIDLPAVLDDMLTSPRWSD